jgi:PASTA domain
LSRGVALLVTTATGVVANTSTLDSGPAPTPPTTPSPGPADPPDTDPGDGSTLPEQELRPDPEPQTVELPTLTGMTRAETKQNLTDYGLKATIKYKSTDQYPGGTVISQLPKAGALVLRSTAVTLVLAKARPAPPPPPPSTAPAQNCDPSYPDMCLDPAVEDYDCTGGQAIGPEYVEGPIRVRPPDPFDLDREGDGWGCENG